MKETGKTSKGPCERRGGYVKIIVRVRRSSGCVGAAAVFGEILGLCKHDYHVLHEKRTSEYSFSLGN